MTDTAITELAPLLGVRAACEAVGAAQAGYYRRHRVSPAPARPAPVPHVDRVQPRALTAAERAEILAELHSPRFAEMSPTEVWAVLLDEGRYLGSGRSRRSTGCSAKPAGPGNAAPRQRIRRR